MRVALCAAVAAALRVSVDEGGGAARPYGGTWYVYQPQTRYASAGGFGVHLLAATLVRAGARVRMAYVSPRLAHVVGDATAVAAVNMTEAEVAALFADGVGPEDTVVAPEVAPEFVAIADDGHVPHSRGTSTDASVAAHVAAVERRGGVVARWMLGASEGWGDAVSPRVSVHVGGSWYLHDAFAGSGPAKVTVPVLDGLLARAAAFRESSAAARPRAPLVVVDASVEIKIFRIRSSWSILNRRGERDHS